MTALVITSGPRNARTDPQSGLRYYRWQGRELPSVTSIRRMAGLPFGLHMWAINQVVSYALDHLADITARVADPAQVAVIRHELRGAATAERDRAAARGTAIHDAAASERTLAEVDAAIASAHRQYLDFMAVSRAETLASEFQCWNLTAGYAGTADRLVRFPNGQIYLVDFKTGKGLYGEHALQLTAYLMAEFVGENDVVDERLTALLHEAEGIGVLHLSDTGWEFRGLRLDPQAWGAFRGLLTFSLWMRDHESIDSVTEFIRCSAEGSLEDQLAASLLAVGVEPMRDGQPGGRP